MRAARQVSRDRCKGVRKSSRSARIACALHRDAFGTPPGKDASMPRPLLPIHRRLVTQTALLCATVLALAGAPGAQAAPGDYTVRLTTTSGSFWSTYGRGPFIATAQRV